MSDSPPNLAFCMAHRDQQETQHTDQHTPLLCCRVGSQVPERLERINTGGGGGGAKQDGPLFDDSGTGANTKLPEKGLLKKSKQMKADGTRYAPWMIIDESAVEKFKRQRAERKKKEQAASKKKGLF